MQLYFVIMNHMNTVNFILLPRKCVFYFLSAMTDECPSCSEPIYRSYVEKFDYANKSIHLCCSACDRRYQVADDEDQRKHIQKARRGKELPREKLTSIKQLGRGDHLRRKLAGVDSSPFFHEMICVDVDRDRGKLTIIDLGPEKRKSVTIRKHQEKFKDFGSNAEVYRYYPLECLPVETTIRLADKLVANPERWINDAYNLVKNNCQHFATFCKTGHLKSTDAKNMDVMMCLMEEAATSYVSSVVRGVRELFSLRRSSRNEGSSTAVHRRLVLNHGLQRILPFYAAYVPNPLDCLMLEVEDAAGDE